jgi:septal ring-binding cell division protein DamX
VPTTKDFAQGQGQAQVLAAPADLEPTKPQDPPSVKDPLAQTSVPGTSTQSELQAYFARTQALLQQPNTERYTLQLAAIPDDVKALGYLKFAGQHVAPATLYAQASTYNGRKFVAVFFGTYGTKAQATAALAGLPDALKVNKPIIRTWAKIRLDQAP